MVIRVLNDEHTPTPLKRGRCRALVGDEKCEKQKKNMQFNKNVYLCNSITQSLLLITT